MVISKRPVIKRPIREAMTERKSVVYAEDKGCLQNKNNGLGRMGKPDRSFVTPNGYVWWVEFKREGEEPTKLQLMEAAELINRHQLHSFVWTFAQFCSALDHILKFPERRWPREWTPQELL